jgi:hypothetical protein
MKTWRDITLRQAIEIDQLGEMDEIDLVINQMAIIRDKTIDEIEALSPLEFTKFVEEYKFMGEIPKAKRVKLFKREGKSYGMIELVDINLAQMVDIEEYYTDGFLKNAHKILSVLYLPVKKKNILTRGVVLEDYKADKEREDMFLDMDMEFVWQNMIFFWTIGQIYTKGLMDYSVEQVVMKTKELRKIKEEVEGALVIDRLNNPKKEAESGTGLE